MALSQQEKNVRLEAIWPEARANPNSLHSLGVLNMFTNPEKDAEEIVISENGDFFRFFVVMWV